MITQERFYRSYTDTDRWSCYRITIDSSDLFIRAKKNITIPASEKLVELRKEITEHIARQESFLTSYSPIEQQDNCSEIIQTMYRASEETGTGPMASVAGAIAEALGKELLHESEEIIIENGGDIWLKISEPVSVNIYTKSAYYHNNIMIKIYPEQTPCGICTSSGKIGPSFSFGKADSVTIISPDTAFADAAATATANIVQDEHTIERALAFCTGISKTKGAVIIYRDTMALQGSIELTD